MIELMIVLVILGLLAAVAIVSYRQYFRRAQASEATSILSNIRIKQEAYRATFRQYFNDPTWRPNDAPTGQGQAWPTTNPWAQLGIRPDTGLTYVYIIEAAAPGTGPSAMFSSQDIDSDNDFWYAARAVEDGDGDGVCSGFEIYHGKAEIVEVANHSDTCP